MERYIIEAILFQGFFLLIYQLLLKKETFFTYNRVYLLLTPILALALPFIQIEALKPAIPTQEFFMQLPTVFIGDPGNTITAVDTPDSDGFTINWLAVYLIGAVISLLIWIKKYLKINRFYRFQAKEKAVPRIIQIPNSDVAFSFLQTIFIGENLDPLSRKQILSHELIHVQQRHTWDLLVFEMFRVLFWFNPLMIQFQKNIATVHEYIADAAVVSDTPGIRKKAYYNELLNTTFGTTQLSFTNTFFNHSLIKKRIIMLQKSKSKQRAKVKYLSILPLILGMLIYVSCVEDEGVQPTNTVVESSNLNKDLPPPPPPPLSSKWISDFTDAWTPETTWEAVKKDARNNGLIIMNRAPKDVEELESLTKQGYILTTQPPKNKTYVTKEEYNVIARSLQNAYGIPVTKERDILVKEPLNKEDIPFAVVDKVPTFPGCATAIDNEARKKCMSESIKTHVNSSFNTKIGEEIGLTGTNRIFVSFKIDKFGNVISIKSRAPHPILEDEAIRVIQSLPQMVPGEQDGKPVGVLYSLPITFKIEE